MRKMTVIILMAAVLLVITTIVCCIHVRGQILDGPGMEREVTEQPTKSLKKVYNEEINPIEQIDQAVAKAKAEGKFVVCQVGGNWCPWCLKFADFIANDTAISKVIDENFEYIHVNYNPRKSQGPEQVEQGKALMKRLDNAGRFGFPVFVILNEEGKILHIQDSSFLEEGEGYNQEKVLRFFKNWTPSAVKG
jgi:thioredoxin-related protein